MLLTLIVIDNRNEEACPCQRRVVVADCGEPVHMQWKLRNGVGSRVYQKKDEKYPQPPQLKKKKLNKPSLTYYVLFYCKMYNIADSVTRSKSLHCSICRNAQCPITNA